jgi:hypothetical protein
MNRVIVWDIETVLDIKGFAAANGHEGKGDDEIRAAMGDKFPKRIYLSFPKIPSGLVAGPTDHRRRFPGHQLPPTWVGTTTACLWTCLHVPGEGDGHPRPTDLARGKIRM